MELSTDHKKLTEMSIEELEIEGAELSVARHQVASQKQALQGRAAELNAQCSVRLPTREFQRIQSERGQIVKEISALETELGAFNSMAREIHAVMEVRKRQAGKFVPSDVRQLVEIRDKWHEFSMDSKNHQKAREVAWKISQELRQFLKPHFSGKE